MRKFHILFYAVWLFVFTVFQPTIIQEIRILGVAPDMFLIFIIAAGLLRGKWDGTICGFVFGFVYDLLVGRMIGISALMYMYAGFLAGTLRERFVSDTCGTEAVFVFAVSLFCGLVYYFAYSMMWGDLGFFNGFVKTVLPKAVYSAVAGFVLFIPIRKSFDIIKDRNVI